MDFFLQLKNGMWKTGSGENRNAETLCYGEWLFSDAWNWQDNWNCIDYELWM